VSGGKARVTNRLPPFIEGVERDAARGVLQAVVLVASEASVRTPIDTGNLLNSQFRSVKKDGTRIVGTIGYTAEYAAAVHDPDNPQNFRRATAQKEFLAKGAEAAAPAVDKAIKGALAVRGPK